MVLQNMTFLGDIVSNRNKRFKKLLCFTLRQWAILFSIVINILKTLLTLLALLAQRHTQIAWDLLISDLVEEQTRSLQDGKRTSNEQILNDAQHSLRVAVTFLDICTIIGCINLVASALLLYGVISRSRKCIAPYLVISSLTDIFIIAFVIYYYMEFFPSVRLLTFSNYASIVVGLGILTVFKVFWFVILLYYMSLKTKQCVAAYGGYMHTLK